MNCPGHRGPPQAGTGREPRPHPGQRHEARGIQGVKDALKCLGHKGPRRPGRDASRARTQAEVTKPEADKGSETP